jgi:hypothetical protein
LKLCARRCGLATGRLWSLPSTRIAIEDFLANQLEGHKELLKIQETYIDKGKDEAAVNLSKLARAQIKEHVDLIETIRKDLKS